MIEFMLAVVCLLNYTEIAALLIGLNLCAVWFTLLCALYLALRCIRYFSIFVLLSCSNFQYWTQLLMFIGYCMLIMGIVFLRDVSHILYASHVTEYSVAHACKVWQWMFAGCNWGFGGSRCKVLFVSREFLARDVIYTSRAYATVLVSVCLWRKCIGAL